MTGEEFKQIQALKVKLAGELLVNVKTNAAEIKSLKDQILKSEEDIVYRFYHQSFKVFTAQGFIKAANELFHKLAPRSLSLDPDYVFLADRALGRHFDPETTNASWVTETGPILEALWHSKYFLEQLAVAIDDPDINSGPFISSGWGAVLHLFNIR